MSKIPSHPEEVFREFVKGYQSILGSDLLSIMLYGSGARGEYIPHKSDINFLILLTENGMNNLPNAFETVSRWRKRSVNTPLFLTKEYIQSSCDVFPIEFLNLKAHHKVIYGEDFLHNLAIEKKFVRLQCERELKGKLLQLRQGLMETRGDKKAIKRLIIHSAPTFFAIFRAMLFLYNIDIPRRSTDVLHLFAQRTGVNQSVFHDIIKIKEGSKKFSAGEAIPFKQEYIEQIKKLSSVIDAM